MEYNAHYLEPMPSQATFASVLDAFDKSYMEVQALRTALRTALAHKDTCRTKLEQALDQRGSYVQALSNGNKATMITAALGVQRKRQKVGPLEPPLGLRVIPGPSTGEVIITWDKVKHSRNYILKYGPEGTPPEHLVLIGRRKRRLMLPVMDVPYIFCIAASGSPGLSSYSPPVKLMVR
ncbi:MAG: fibronectin type III domain-containing protein [Prosthecobacter sp.]